MVSVRHAGGYSGGVFFSFLGFSCSWRRFLSFLGFSCSGVFFNLSISVGLHCHSLLVNWESQDDIRSPKPPQFACKLGKQDGMQSPKPPQFACKLGKSGWHAESQAAVVCL